MFCIFFNHILDDDFKHGVAEAIARQLQGLSVSANCTGMTGILYFFIGYSKSSLMQVEAIKQNKTKIKQNKPEQN